MELGACIIQVVSFKTRLPVELHVGRVVFGALKRGRNAVRPVRRAARIVRHVMAYRVPDELNACPVCGAPAPRALMPIPLEGRVRSYGFASGCERCGVVFANPLPSAAQVAAVYSPAGEWGRHRQDEQEKQVSRGRLELYFQPVSDTFSVLQPPPGGAVLDFGCGLGGMLDGFAALGWQTYGIEPAMKGAFARHHELEEIPTSGAFDLGVLHHVLEHVTDPLTILKQMAGAVREGGFLLISVPNLDSVSVHGEMKYCIRAGVHVLAYTSACLTWLAAEAGFEVVSDRSGLSEERQRHRVVLARRRVSPVPRPSAPLDAATRALARYAATREDRSALRLLPVRMQAAVLDLQRTRWRI